MWIWIKVKWNNFWKGVYNFFTNTDTVLKAAAIEITDDMLLVLEDIKANLEEDRKYFLVEMDVAPTTKLRNLKTTMEVALVEKLAKTNPSINDIVVKSYYHKKK